MDRSLRIRMLLEAGDRFSRPLRDLTTGAGRAGQALAETRDRLKAIERAQADVAGFRQLKTGLRSTEAGLQAARQRLTELGRQMGQAGTPTRELARDFARARTETQRLERQHQAESTRLTELRQRLREAGISTTDLARHERELRQQAAGTNREIEEQARRMQHLADRNRRFSAARAQFGRSQAMSSNMVGTGMGGLATAAVVAAPLVGSAKDAMGLEEAMAGVAKVTGMSAGQIQLMTGSMVDLSTRIPMTAVELANIAASAGAAGVGMDAMGRPLRTQAQELVAFTDAAARMGIAFDMTAEDAGGTMAKWRQAFKMTQPEVEALGDRINALTNKFGGSAPAVAGIVTRIGPLGEVAGLAASAVAALASSMASIGIEEEVAATGIKNTVLTLTKGTAATKGQQAALKSLGLDAVKVAKSMQVDADGTIVNVLERIRSLSKDKQASLLSELFGSESVGAIAPLLTNLDGLKQRLHLVGDAHQYAGSMTAEFLSRIGTTQGAADLAMNGLRAVNLALGQHLLPYVKEGAQRVAAFAGRMRTWATDHPGMAKGLLLIGAGVAILVGGFGALSIAAAAVMGPIAIVGAGLTALGVSGEVATVGLLPILGTVALIVGGIALLAGAAYLIYNNWGAISGFFTGIWDSVAGAFTRNWTTIRNIALGALVVFFPMVTAIIFVAKKIYDNWAAIRAGVSAGIAYLGAMVQPFVQPFIRIAAALGSMIGRFVQFGVDIVRGIAKGIFGAAGWLLKTVGNLAGQIGARFASALGIHSPSRVFMSYGGFMMQGLDQGIAGGADAPVRRIGDVSDDLTDAFSATPGSPLRIQQSSGILTRALTIGAAAGIGTAPAMAAPPAAPVGVAAMAAPASMHFHIHGAPGQSPQDLAREVARAVKEEMDRRDRAAGRARRSSLADTPDWS